MMSQSSLKLQEQVFSLPDTPEKKRFQRWLDDRISRGKKRFFVEPAPVIISPVLAELMLARNTDNRRIRRNKVEGLKLALKEKRWKLHLQGVSFDTNGTLDNGQHRLTAIVETGESALMTVAFGQSPEVYGIIDTQTPRNTGDVFQRKGEKYAVALAAAGRLLNNITEFGEGRGNVSVDNETLTAFVEDKHPDLRDSCHIGSIGFNLKCAPTPLIVAHYLITRKYSAEKGEHVDTFFETLRSGLGLAHNRDPIRVLREAILKGLGKTGPRATITACTIKAWNAWRKGRRVSSVAWDKSESFPTVE